MGYIPSEGEMDVVIPLGRGTKWKDNELRYALRSIERYAKGVDKIWVVGERPTFLTNVSHISQKDVGQKEFNIMVKTRVACLHPDVSEDFLFTNDDIFFTRETEISQTPYYRRPTTLSDGYVKDRGNYQVSIGNTIKALSAHGFKDYYFDIHTPIIYSKKKYIEVMRKYHWGIPKGYVIKSLYANTLGIGGEVLEDVKIRTPLESSQIMTLFATNPFVSIGDGGMNTHLKETLEKLFPEKSRYEL